LTSTLQLGVRVLAKEATKSFDMATLTAVVKPDFRKWGLYGYKPQFNLDVKPVSEIMLSNQA